MRFHAFKKATKSFLMKSYFTILCKKLVVQVVLASTIITSVITAIALFTDYKTELQLVDQRLRQMEVTTLDSLASALWDYNDSQIKVELQGIENLPDISNVKILDPNKKTLYEIDDKKEESSNAFERHLRKQVLIKNFPIIYHDENNTQQLGFLQVGITKVNIYKRLFDRMFLFFLLQGMKTLIVSFVMLVLFQRIVFSHLMKTINYLKNASHNKFIITEPLKLNRSSGKEDELDSLVESINNLMDSVKKGFEAQRTLLKVSENELSLQRARNINAARLAELGEMAGGLAHEINNPIAVINGYLYRAQKALDKKEVDTETIHESFDKIQGMVDRISKIIYSLRLFSRDGSRDEFTLNSIQKIIDDTVELSKIKSKDQGVEIRVKVPKDSIEIECRIVEISQAFLNVISNAIYEVGSQLEKWVEIELLDLKNKIQVSITDSGLGIPKEIVDKIMNPFFTTKEPGVGTGLGLSITKGIVDSHRGEFFVDKNSEHTRFVFILPKRQSSISNL